MVRRPLRFRFGLWSMLLLMFVCAVTAAAASYLQKQDAKSNRGVFVIFSLAAPVVVLVAVSAAHRVSIVLRKHKRNRK